MTALQDINIADFSWVGAGPRATKDLADNGATVVKVESRKRLDLGRRSPPFAGDSSNADASAFFAQTNTSKYSVTINLSEPRGVEVAKSLIAWADVVVENFGPGFMDRIGLGYEELKRIKPEIILASVSVAGRTGPMAGFRGYGNSAAAHSGHAAMSGWPGHEPHMPPFAYGDVIAPMFATVAILGALEERARTGQGQHLDISQIEPMVHVLADLYAEADEPEKPGNGDPVMSPHNVYPTRDDDGWIAISVENDSQWQALCRAFDQPNQAVDARFASAESRRNNSTELDEWLSDLTRQHTAETLAADLCRAGVPAAPVLNGKTLFDDPELNRCGHFTTLDHPVLGASKMPTPPMQMSDTPSCVGRSPLLGEHTRLVLVDWLGMSPEQVETLQREEVLA
ncbi:CaiB/BaiF CoA transferase family protein [Saccharospirillum alexandrii]|uniref:CaiB/BaiF CoA transferase family protein n=1 Tax=Saccharospirillum alexandrii TaxID=2448477 RepID=UPI000FDB8F65|nr:CoA transferase [Saccharospirillum alexandrii]